MDDMQSKEKVATAVDACIFSESLARFTLGAKVAIWALTHGPLKVSHQKALLVRESGPRRAPTAGPSIGLPLHKFPIAWGEPSKSAFL